MTETHVIETFTTRAGRPLQVAKELAEHEFQVSLNLTSPERCFLHWGLRRTGQGGWEQPPHSAWPADTDGVGRAAAQTPFVRDDEGSRVVLHLPTDSPYVSLDFVLFFPEQNTWDNNHGRNYRIELPQAQPRHGELARALQPYLEAKKSLFHRVFAVEPHGSLGAVVTREENRFVVRLFTDIPGPLLLHWGIARYSLYDWSLPPASVRPPQTVLFENHAAQTPFTFQDALGELRLEFAEAEAPMGLQFVLKQPDSNRWLRFRGGNFSVPVRIDYEQRAHADSPELAGIADQIIQAEMGRNSWTLMHRFNLCHDLLDRVGGAPDGLALLFVWLRYSALRQLTWQRNYNTKPRELSHAQDRLTQKLTQLYSREPSSRPLARQMLASVGPGGDGQRIRDEILAIMHRHHIKEVAGHFMEEWHQKLHNNTTPDDVVLCEAYLEFLYSNGDLNRFYQKLQAGGVTKQRLESFERPIRTHPDFIPHLKEPLIGDFQHFLRILRAVHEGTDLETAINAARSRLDGDTQGLLWRLWDHRHGQVAFTVVVDEITEARRRLQARLAGGEATRELLYLDLALGAFLRTVVERNLDQATAGDVLVELIARILENRLLGSDDAELAVCARHWQRLKDQPRFGPDWALHAKSAADRIARLLSERIDTTYQLLQPKAELLGHAFHAEPWVITLFSEEVVRGSSVDFVLSLLLHRLEPRLRQAAHLGHWQIISRGCGSGEIEVVDQLRTVQGKSFATSRVIVADHVGGDEELPEQVAAVIAPDVTDIVSHVAVRARNAGLLFAACHDPETLKQLKARRGQRVQLRVSPDGNVLIEEAGEEVAKVVQVGRVKRAAPLRPAAAAWVLAESDFAPSVTGGKSLNLARLAGKLPDWIRRPASIALPFGICERVLEGGQNRAVAEEYRALQQGVAAEPDQILPKLRETILELNAPQELTSKLRAQAVQAKLPWPWNWEAAWSGIKRVWASKWNDRAFYSRQTQGLAHEDLFMAVLIQQVIEADYAFVIHTTNPMTGRPEELYVEMVVGLGETLVGNYPGRALSAVCEKQSLTPSLLAYPGKSLALRGSGLIFRSDSNGEDLAGFAGAGLYDSVVVPEPQQTLVDYSAERLVWDEPFRHAILQRLTELGVAVETALGAPQDIEGVVRGGEYYIVQTRPQVGLVTTQDRPKE